MSGTGHYVTVPCLTQINARPRTFINILCRRPVMMETSMTENTEAAAKDLTADLAALRQDVARLAETMKEQTQAAADRLSEAVGDARDRIASAAADAQSRIRAASGEFETRIERNPLTAVLIAFGIGMSLGMMTRRHS